MNGELGDFWKLAPVITKPNLSIAFTVRCHRDLDVNCTISSTAPTAAVRCAAALAAESAGVTGTWAEAIEPHASASIGNPKINFVIVFIMLSSNE